MSGAYFRYLGTVPGDRAACCLWGLKCPSTLDLSHNTQDEAVPGSMLVPHPGCVFLFVPLGVGWFTEIQQAVWSEVLYALRFVLLPHTRRRTPEPLPDLHMLGTFLSSYSLVRLLMPKTHPHPCGQNRHTGPRPLRHGFGIIMRTVSEGQEGPETKSRPGGLDVTPLQVHTTYLAPLTCTEYRSRT